MYRLHFDYSFVAFTTINRNQWFISAAVVSFDPLDFRSEQIPTPRLSAEHPGPGLGTERSANVTNTLRDVVKSQRTRATCLSATKRQTTSL